MAIAWKVCNLLVNRKIGLRLRGLDAKDPQCHNDVGQILYVVFARSRSYEITGA
jgi:hypothetical protein